jgi:Flp pilus assembly protein TadB
VAFVSASELQTTQIEARLTQRVEQMIQQRGGQVSPEQPKGQELPRRTVTPLEAAPRTAVASVSYVFLLINVLLFLCGVILLWRWWRHLSIEERQARLATWRTRVAFRGAKAVDSKARQHR